MGFIIAAVAALFFLSRKNSASPTEGIPQGTVAPTPVIKQSVGTSLSAALGNQSRPPAHYSTGNPGSGAGVPSSTVQFYNPPTTFHVPVSPSNPGVNTTTRGVRPTQYAPVRPIYIAARPSVGSNSPVSSALANPTQVNRYVRAPETQGAFWTQARIPVTIVRKT